MDVVRAYIEVFAALNKEEPKIPSNLDPKRAQFLRVALSQLGQSDPVPYLKAVLSDTSKIDPEEEWCGIFALWALQQAGMGTAWKWQPGVGFLGNLPTTDNPQPGDIGYSDEKNHHAIIESVNGNAVNSIDGNSWEGKVQRNTRDIGFYRAFYSIQPLVDKAEKEEEPSDQDPIQQQFENTMKLLLG